MWRKRTQTIRKDRAWSSRYCGLFSVTSRFGGTIFVQNCCKTTVGRQVPLSPLISRVNLFSSRVIFRTSVHRQSFAGRQIAKEPIPIALLWLAIWLLFCQRSLETRLKVNPFGENLTPSPSVGDKRFFFYGFLVLRTVQGSAPYVSQPLIKK